MSWVKRNFFFVLSSVVALGLMALGGFYIYSRWALNNEMRDKLNANYTALKAVKEENPNPGSPGSVDNIKTALEQQQQIRAFITNAAMHFKLIPPIPDLSQVKNENKSQEFAAALRRTIDQLQRDATNASVSLPPKYDFTFEAQRSLVQFAPGSLEPLSARLGEVKAISDILIRAKINSLDGLRRERVSADDTAGPQTDYTEQRSQTNSLAILTPYEITFRCFGPELAAVLAGFASSTNGFIVRDLSVEPASAAAAEATSTTAAPVAVQPVYNAPPPPPPPASQAPPRRSLSPEEELGEERPGMPGPGRVAPPPMPRPGAPPAKAPASVSRGSVQTMLNEKQLKVTMSVVIVKLLPVK
jgi:hypothetical protein